RKAKSSTRSKAWSAATKSPNSVAIARIFIMASKNVAEFTSENWKQEVVLSATPVVVDFWAPWCGPCRALTPIIEKLAEQYAGKVKVGKVNVDDNPDLATQYGVVNIPRVLIFKGSDKPVHTIVGLTSETDIVNKVKSVMSA